MKIFGRLLSVAVLFGFSCLSAYSIEDTWHNDLRSKFLNNDAVIMEINIRSFNSNDINGDGFIQEKMGEKKGTFLNAIDRLDELKNLGINTIHILPITPTGKLKALGTAGSLYSAAAFDTISEDLYDKDSKLSLEEHYEFYQKSGLSKKEIIKKIAKDRKVDKNTIYQYFLEK